MGKVLASCRVQSFGSSQSTATPELPSSLPNAGIDTPSQPFTVDGTGGVDRFRVTAWPENSFEGDFVVWDKPVVETCPECGYVGAEAKFTKTRGDYRRCIKCANEWDVAPSPETEAVAV